ncbi:MAG: glycosyltransferase [Armatimonadota bacterium]|nr:glycosyltransferase [Armatimonadota bacterium]
MRVLVVTNMYPSERKPYQGIFVRESVDALRSIGVEVDVLAIDNSSKWNYLLAVFRLWRMIRAKSYDLIHAHYVHSGWIARMQFALPVVVTSHGSDTKGHEGWFLRRLYPLVDAVTITSKQNQQRIGLTDTYLLPCGVDVELFKPMDQTEARRILGWETSRKKMLYVGRESPGKRLDIIKEAHAIVASRRGDTDLVIASAVPHEQVPVYMNAADVFVFASESEGAPVVIKEALACNLPVVSVDVGDVREVIEGVENCYICDRNAESMAEAVLRVLQSAKRSNGRRVALEYSTAQMAQRTLQIYKAVLSSAGAQDERPKSS